MLQMNAIGNLGRDAEVKKINNREYITFSLACNNNKKDEEPTWVEVIMPLNDRLIKYLRKGTSVMITGSPKMTTYKSKTGEEKVQISIFASFLQMIGTRRTTDKEQTKIVETPQEKFPTKEDLPF